MEYFVLSESGQRVGPYDPFALMRQIQNGKVDRGTMLEIGDTGETLRAGDVPQLKPFFNSDQEEAAPQHYTHIKLHFFKLLKEGLDFSMQHMSVLALSCLTILAQAFGNVLFAKLFGNGLVFAMLAPLWSVFIFALFAVMMLAKTRMQHKKRDYLLHVSKTYAKPLLIYSFIVGFLTFGVAFWASLAVGPAAMLLVLLPGSAILLFCVFAPLLIVDRQMGAIEAIKYSINAVGGAGTDNFVTLYLLILINFIAMALFVVPVVLSLPVTYHALCEIYDHHIDSWANSY